MARAGVGATESLSSCARIAPPRGARAATREARRHARRSRYRIDKLAELDEARFDGSAPLDEEAALDLAVLSKLGAQLVNRPRIESARSKVGEGSGQALVEEVVLDVLVDLEATFPRALRELGQQGEEALRIAVGRAAADAIAAGRR